MIGHCFPAHLIINEMVCLATNSERQLYAKYIIDLISSFQHLGSFTIRYDWRLKWAANAIIYCLTNCTAIKNFTCIGSGGIPEKERKSVQQQFIKSFEERANSVKFTAANWEIKFGDDGQLSIEKRN